MSEIIQFKYDQKKCHWSWRIENYVPNCLRFEEYQLIILYTGQQK